MDELHTLRRKSVPLYVELATILRNRILNGTHLPGTRLPTLKELTGDLGVSRVTARQAMDILESEGLIERGSGRGTFVTQRPVTPCEKLEMTARIGSLQTLVRGSEVSIVSTKPETFDLYSSFEGISASELESSFAFLRRIHSKYNVPFSLVDVFIRKDVFEIAPESFRNRIAIEVISELKIPISSADQVITIASAGLEDAKLLKQSVNSPIADVRRVFRGRDGNVFYAARIKYPSSFISFHIHFEP